MKIDGQERRSVVWPEWSITTQSDATGHWRRVRDAISCHRTQLPGYEALGNLPEGRHRNLCGNPKYYLVFSLVNGGPGKEADLPTSRFLAGRRGLALRHKEIGGGCGGQLLVQSSQRPILDYPDVGDGLAHHLSHLRVVEANNKAKCDDIPFD